MVSSLALLQSAVITQGQIFVSLWSSQADPESQLTFTELF